MTTRISKLAFFFGVVVVVTIGWNVFVWYKQSLLSTMAEPFVAACQSAAGCVIAPKDWKANDDGSYYKAMYEYTATKDSFILRQHLAVDVWLVAEGGRGKSVRTHRVIN